MACNSSRRNVRIEAMKILYNIDLLKTSVEDAARAVFDDEYNIDTITLVNNVLENEERVIKIISDSLIGYSYNRLSYVDRAIIKIATYEMLSGLPSRIAINEAVEITKKYSNLDDDKAKAFNNKLLDSIAKKIELS